VYAAIRSSPACLVLTDADSRREVDRLLEALESARPEYAKAHLILDDGDLQALLACMDKKSPAKTLAIQDAGKVQFGTDSGSGDKMPSS
jgi:hypothetical protein